MTDAEDVKKSTRKYFSTYFDSLETKCDNVAKMCLFLTESVLIEQGIASEVMKAETIKLHLQGGQNLHDIIEKRNTETE